LEELGFAGNEIVGVGTDGVGRDGVGENGHMKWKLVKDLFFKGWSGSLDDDVSGAVFEALTEVTVKGEGGDGAVSGVGDEGGGDLVGGKYFMDEVSDGGIAGVASDGDDFEIIGRTAV